jgi:hypothetical protein
MTRINVVPAKELLDEHLRAEYREITRIPNHLVKVGMKPNMDNQPSRYTLGTGHVKFFYAEMAWLKKRFEELSIEMDTRGFKTGKEWNYTFSIDLSKDYKVTEEDLKVNRGRIMDRMPKNPHYYKEKVRV